jgi:hypothetical protein
MPRARPTTLEFCPRVVSGKALGWTLSDAVKRVQRLLIPWISNVGSTGAVIIFAPIPLLLASAIASMACNIRLNLSAGFVVLRFSPSALARFLV